MSAKKEVDKLDAAELALRQVIAAHTVNGVCKLTEGEIKQHAFVEAGNAFPKRGYLQPVMDKLLERIRYEKCEHGMTKLGGCVSCWIAATEGTQAAKRRESP